MRREFRRRSSYTRRARRSAVRTTPRWRHWPEKNDSMRSSCKVTSRGVPSVAMAVSRCSSTPSLRSVIGKNGKPLRSVFSHRRPALSARSARSANSRNSALVWLPGPSLIAPGSIQYCESGVTSSQLAMGTRPVRAQHHAQCIDRAVNRNWLVKQHAEQPAAASWSMAATWKVWKVGSTARWSFRLPDMAAAGRWYQSDAYQAILPLRTENAKCNAFLVHGVKDGHRATDVMV